MRLAGFCRDVLAAVQTLSPGHLQLQAGPLLRLFAFLTLRLELSAQGRLAAQAGRQSDPFVEQAHTVAGIVSRDKTCVTASEVLLSYASLRRRQRTRQEA